ncbi:MAG: VWA domain-containing protein [Deltaproteobacteria bacterium]|nr:VWA domain-containing protein [Deltaproteobacteria bacterium]
MSLAGYSLATLGKLFAAAGGVLVVLYILKLRRRRFEVPFSKLWQRVLEEKESTSLFRRLKRLLSLLLQLALVALLVLALGDPFTGDRQAEGRHIVLVLDTSASMRALDLDGQSRFVKARKQADELLAALSPNDAVLVLRTDGQTAAPSWGADAKQVQAIVGSMQPTDVPADMRRVLRAAADALRGRKKPELIIIGDGAYEQDELDAVDWGGAAAGAVAASRPVTEPAAATAGVAGATAASKPAATPAKRLDAIDLGGVKVHYLAVGDRKDNIGIVEFNVRRYLANKLSFEIFLEIQNFSDQDAEVQVELVAGGETIDVKTVSVPRHDKVRQIYPNRSGVGHFLEARLSRAPAKPGAATNVEKDTPLDAFALDDRAFALLPSRAKESVLVVTEGNMFLEGALMLDENIEVFKIEPGGWAAAAADPSIANFAAVVFDGYTPATLPARGNFIFIAPSGPGSPFAIAGETERPFMTEINKSHPILRWVTVADVNISRSAVFTPGPGDIVLASNIRQPIMMARREKTRRLMALGFDVRQSDLPMRVAWPVLLINTLDWFAGDDAELMTTFHTGKLWRIPFDTAKASATLVEPDGAEVHAAVAEGRVTVLGRRVGFHTVKGDDQTPVQIAANLADPVESDITPHGELTMAGVKLSAPPPASRLELPSAIWLYLLLAVLALTLVEWTTYSRRVTV